MIKRAYNKARRFAGRHSKALLIVGALALTGVSAHAQGNTGIVDLSSAGTQGATNITQGATAALPVFGGMVAVGAVVMGFRRLAH